MEESCSHIFIHCPRAKEFWDLMPCPTMLHINLSWADWITKNLECSSPANNNIPSDVNFCFALWHIWKRRNDWIFSKINSPISFTVRQCSWAAYEYFYSRNIPESQKPSTIAWSPPPSPLLKINCDASFLPATLQTGCAVVCRNNLGEWVEGFIWKGYAPSSHDAELKAIQLSLQWIKERGWKNAMLCSDAKRAVDEIKQDQISANISNCITNCRDLLQELHLLASFSLSSSSFKPRAAFKVEDIVPSFWGNEQERLNDEDDSGCLEDLASDSPVYQKTLRLVECAMFAAVAGLTYLLSNSLAIENYFGCFFALPIVITSMRWGIAAGRKTMVATAVLLLVLSGPVKALTYVVRAIGALGYVVTTSFLIRENILALITVNVHATLTLILNSLGFNTVPSMNTIYAIFGTLAWDEGIIGVAEMADECTLVSIYSCCEAAMS
uniref:RNase H type-1 domain-containing protein n=1 Tax=Chenopodium quinoa TaxID=63459 RepID=A0A803KVB9_CHEQI